MILCSYNVLFSYSSTPYFRQKKEQKGFEVLARVFDSTKHLGATDMGMTFRVPHFGTLGIAQYGDGEEYTLKPEGP